MRNFAELLNSYAKKIVVIGDLMIDEYVIGKVDRISPEAPVPVLKFEKEEFRLGGAANVAVNCRQINKNVEIIGLIGEKDFFGKKLISLLCNRDICNTGIVESKFRITTNKRRVVSNNQQLLRIDFEDSFFLKSEERKDLISKIKEIINENCIVLIPDYNKGVIDKGIILEVIDQVEKFGGIIIADPKGLDFDKYENVNYIKPNLKEFNQMVRFFDLNKRDSIVSNGRQICKKLSLDGLIITKGEEGIEFISEFEHKIYPVYKRDVYDVCGAGDTVLAFLGIGLARDFTMNDSLNLANKAASIAVSKHKTYVVTIEDLIDSKFDYKSKVFNSWSKLKSKLDVLRESQNKKIVFTNGTFDLIHSGHITVLNEAKRMGDILVVALNTDASVKRYKGSVRPIKNLEERMNVMSSIGVVDFVVPFEQDTPKEIIDLLKPDVLVKGGDYKIENIVGYDTVISYGGVVKVIDYKPEHSTSNLISKINQFTNSA